MKNKLHLSETNLISLIKRVLLEQDDMDTPETLAQRQQQTVTQQTPATVQQQSANYCPYGYQQVTQGPYFICSESKNIIPLQQALKVNPDGKFGTNTLRAVYARFKKISVTDEDIKSIALNAKTFPAGATPNAQNTTNKQLSTAGLVRKINQETKSLGFVKDAYTQWGQIYLRGKQNQPIYSTNCESLMSKPPKFNDLNAAGYVKSISDSTDSSFISNIYNYFCKNTNKISVTNAVKSDLVILGEKNKVNIKIGNSFTAEKYNNNIQIKNENGKIVFYTECGSNLDKGFFTFKFNIGNNKTEGRPGVLTNTKSAVQNLCTKK
jgi:hypothetical protein